MNILLAVCGSISAYKTPSIANGLRATGNNVKVVMTESSKKFITKLSFSSQEHETYEDADEFNSNKVLHIDLQNWADVILIAPCTANTLSKIANGIADNLLTNIIRAQPINKPLIIAPAMNNEMYKNEFTREALEVLSNHFSNFYEIPPIRKKLVCGVEDIGALAKTRDIIKFVNNIKI